MINKFVNITSFNKLLTYLVALLPLILISGPFFSDLLISLSSIIFLLIIISKKKYKYFNNLFTYIFLSLCAYYILRSILSENIYLSLESSLFYIRFGIFSILIFYLLDNEKSFKNLFLYSLLFAFFILVVDGFIQYLFGYNLIGLPYESNRISSFFGEEKILGSYLSRLFPILVALVFISDLSHKMKITLIITAIGAVAGFAYASVLGCDSVCSMTSSSLNTTVYGAFAGLLIAFPISKKIKKK